MKKIVEISKLIKDYGRLTNQYKVLKGIDLEINEGEFISIKGKVGKRDNGKKEKTKKEQ